jgi:hypothetical protein
MSDYLQDIEKLFFDELVNEHIVARDGEILNNDRYMEWLNRKSEDIRSQIRQIPEPGDAYDRYRANLLYKDMDVIHKMIGRQKGSIPSAAQKKSENREQELMNKKSIFSDALGWLRKHRIFNR